MSLPSIIMPEPVPEPEVFPAKSAKIIDNIENRQDEQSDMVVQDISSDEESKPVESDKEEDVFKDAPTIKPIVDNVEQEEIPEIPEKKERKKYERKKPMSDKQKAHLEKIRKIASEKRRIAREEKAKAKEEAVLKKAEEKLKKDQEKKAQDAKDKLKAEEEENLKQASSRMYSQMDLEEAMVNAVSTYDAMRKERKIKKKQLQEEQAHKTAQKNMISRAIQPQQINPNQTAFSHCFM